MLENISIEKLQECRTMSEEEIDERNAFYIQSIVQEIAAVNLRGETVVTINNRSMKDLFQRGAWLNGINQGKGKPDMRSYSEVADFLVDFFSNHTDLEISVTKTGVNTPAIQTEVTISWEVR